MKQTKKEAPYLEEATKMTNVRGKDTKTRHNLQAPCGTCQHWYLCGFPEFRDCHRIARFMFLEKEARR